MEDLPGQLDLRNLLNLDKADRVFQEILRRVAAQSAELVELRALVARCATTEMLQSVGSTLQASVRSLDSRVSSLEHNTALPTESLALWSPSVQKGNSGVVSSGSSARPPSSLAGSPPSTIGEAVATTAASIAALAAKVHTKAGSDELGASAAEEHRKALATEVEKLRKESATKTFTDALEQSQVACAEHVGSLQQSLALKADRHQLTAIEATCAKLRAFEAHVQDSSALVASLQKQSEEAQVASDQQRSELSALRKTVDLEHSPRLERCARREDVGTLRKRVEALQLALHGEATKAVKTSEATTTSLEERRTAHDLLAKEVAADGEVWRGGLSALETKVSTLPPSLDGLVNASTLAQTFNELRSVLDTKAGLSPFLSLRQDVHTLATAKDEQGKQLGLALRFIDWFSDRGESYEHNLRALDSQLGNLAERSAPRRQPYDGFTRSTGPAAIATPEEGEHAEAAAAPATIPDANTTHSVAAQFQAKPPHDTPLR
mmetsp:Transcript_42754/g.86446  ORF Transcript_42754/g.86446 Transcript_42754/m.86446 type:complete len:493 (-) Transcript_42754:314-1792(-)